MDYSPPGSSVHEIFQARTLKWAVIQITMCPDLLKYFSNKQYSNQNPQMEDKIFINSESNETHVHKDVHECDSI